MNFTNLFFNENIIVNIFAQTVFAVISLFIGKEIFKVNLSIKTSCVYVFTNIVCFSAIHMLTNYLYACTFMYLTSIILSIFWIKDSSSNSFFYFSLKFIITLNIYFLVFNYFENIFNFSTEAITYSIFTITYLFIFSIIGFLICFCTRHRVWDNLLITCINQNSKKIVAISLLNLIISCIFFTIYFEHLLNNPIYLIVLDLYFVLSIILIIHICNKSYNMQKINNLQLCNKTILELCDSTRAFKHDFHNIIQAMGGYILTNDIEGLKKYYKDIYGECVNSNNLDKLNPELINNPAIYNILADKYYVADDNNIQVNLEVMLDLNNLDIKIYELTRILGILLDNAIEASKECNKKNINILFKRDKYKQMLIIENTYQDKQISIDKIFEKNFSTKPHNTGLGLWEVRKILSKHSNLNLYTTKNDNYFSQQLEIYSA